MVVIDPEFVAPTIPDGERYEGTEVDPGVLKALPKGITVKWSSTYGASFWAISTKIDTILPNGEEKSYFLKVYTAGKALDIARGEYESTLELASILPQNVPNPVGYGICENDSNRAFFLAEFRDMTDELPGVTELVSLVVKFHQKTSANGKFGYHVPTFAGKHAIDTSWTDTWEEFFLRIMKDTMDAEIAIHGSTPELAMLNDAILTKVIPRLIRPMETEGRKIKPSLVHGDLWHGNVSVDNITNDPVIYDPCCFYAHNEYDFTLWRASRYRTNRAHVRAYFQQVARTEPEKEQDDRHALYALRGDLAVSVLWPANKRIRELAIEEMKRLVAKYGDGYEGYLEERAREQEAGEAIADETPLQDNLVVC